MLNHSWFVPTVVMTDLWNGYSTPPGKTYRHVRNINADSLNEKTKCIKMYVYWKLLKGLIKSTLFDKTIKKEFEKIKRLWGKTTSIQTV